jgi:hypothetical protein
MTAIPDTWTIASAADAARARAATARLTASAGVPLVERTRFLTSVTGKLRWCLDQGGAWDLLVRTHRADADGRRRLDVMVRPAARHAQGHQPDWQLSIMCPEAGHGEAAGPVHVDGAGMAEALLEADEDTAELLERLDAQEGLARSYREELHQTTRASWPSTPNWRPPP